MRRWGDGEMGRDGSRSYIFVVRASRDLVTTNELEATSDLVTTNELDTTNELEATSDLVTTNELEATSELEARTTSSLPH